MSIRASLEFLLLIVALAAESLVLYLVNEPETRLAIGLLLLALIVWSAARLGVQEFLPSDAGKKINERRFTRLRSQVGQLLDEIRRLNWMAVDAKRGVRDRETATQEMDVIERRLKDLIEEIRSVAGQMSLEEEAQTIHES